MTNVVSKITSLSEVTAIEWNQLLRDNNPFLKYEFLLALEECDCLGKQVGWHPHHFIISDSDKRLIGAMPCYLKSNSFGEFVFDWSWASAYEQHGLNYYPKLLAAIPFTPVTGPRLLTRSDVDHDAVKKQLIDYILNYAQDREISTVHCLFPDHADTQILQNHNLLMRLQYQYHWHNRDYEDFEHYLSFFRSRKRKNVKQERASLRRMNIETRVLHGDELDENLWQIVNAFYQSTFLKKGNYPALSLAFFRRIAALMGEKIVVIIAEQHGEPIGAAINLRSDTHLYGRYWGCAQEIPHLHFDVCFYAGIDYCIQHGLQVFEPGVQGEHKITRGFLPQETWSAHWIGDERFRSAITDFLRRERLALKHHRKELESLSPFHKAEAQA